MWNYIWPLILVVGANTIYHITAKSAPAQANAFLMLTLTYLVAMVGSFIFYLISSPAKGIVEGLGQLNWTSYVLGVAIIGLEAGYIFLYRAGWKISVGPMVSYAFLALTLIAVGVLFFQEQLAAKQIVGVLLCVGGILLIRL